ncbi:MAG: amidohydrolase, partial [Candidatus Latescibacterota bacterium]|nr:amidohydrolase [Candidatus Latescibacterota bacterium]
TIEVGKDADLVLVAANPLDDLAVLRDPVGVMRNGQWLSAEDDLAAIREDARSNQLSLYAAGVRLAEHVVRNY